jgi:hypothetical protein
MTAAHQSSCSLCHWFKVTHMRLLRLPTFLLPLPLPTSGPGQGARRGGAQHQRAASNGQLGAKFGSPSARPPSKNRPTPKGKGTRPRTGGRGMEGPHQGERALSLERKRPGASINGERGEVGAGASPRGARPFPHHAGGRPLGLGNWGHFR